MATVFINEFHYLNIGDDTNEFVEIAGPAGTDLTNYSIVAYKDDGTIFQQKFLSGIIPIQDPDGFGTVSINFDDGIPALGAIALVNNDTVDQFLSYGGNDRTVTATVDPIGVTGFIGAISNNIGVGENDTTTLATGSLQLQGTGDDPSDFTWVAVDTASSNGDVNDSQDFTTIATPDTTAPTFLGATTPADNSIGVAVGTNISFTLSEDVIEPGNGNITISSEGEDDIVIAADSSQVTINGGVVTINPTADLINGKEYTVEIESGAFTDAAENPFNGTLATDGTFNFITVAEDTTAPTLIGTPTPANNAENVPANTNISFTLSEDAVAVAGKSIRIGDIEIDAADTTQVTINGGVVTINPTADLINSIGYIVEIESGAFTDAAGNPFDGELATDGLFNFITVAATDTTAPTFSGTLTPADNSTGVAVGTNISFTLSEDAVAVPGKNITISSDGEDDIVIAADSSQVTINGGLVTINPTADLMNGKEYTVEIESGAFTDAAENPFNGVLATDEDGFNFTTIAAPVTTPDDTDAPTFLGTLTPADNSTGVAVGTNISFTLNEDVKAVAGKFIIISEGEDSFRIAADDSSQVTIAGGVVTINPSFNLMNGKDYTVEIESGAFTDDAGNPFNGELVDGEDYNFTTVAAAVTPPPTPDPITPVSPGSTIGTVTEGNNVMEVIDLRRFAGETVTATYEISREANYDNNIYFYKVDSADGSIDGIATDESGYLAKALGNVVNTGITADDDANNEAGSFTLQGGDILGIAFVADGTLLQATSNLDSVEGVYLSFMGANTDNGTFDHVKFENNMLKFEDLANGGDNDFNDIELKIDFA
ncbi:MAG: Ig-like domain-containing protein [Rivularia sp. (in: cyanobacteria)]